MKSILIFGIIFLTINSSYSQTRRSSTSKTVKAGPSTSDNLPKKEGSFLGETSKETKKETTTQVKTSTNNTSTTPNQTTEKPLDASELKSIETKEVKTSATISSNTKDSSKSSSKDLPPRPVVTKSDDIDFNKSADVKDVVFDSKPVVTSSNTISNSSAIANGQTSSPVNDPYSRKVRPVDQKLLEQLQLQRLRYDKEQKELKASQAAVQKVEAKKEESAFNSRHLTDEQAPQFDKYRNGATNSKDEPVVKKTAGEEYDDLFR